MDTEEEGGCVMYWEIRIDIYIYCHVSYRQLVGTYCIAQRVLCDELEKWEGVSRERG